ncbi:AAA family ATPase [Pseudomonas sp. KT_2_4]|jgi:hypothetical protein|uniref:AAA family ATPase n=1 Tax=Pseudomonas sp. KT_2_4 TaxID=3241600 RepID=UPI00352B289A
MLKSFSVENYRSFSRKQDIELRPLTLFFGWNSGGKSALLRFLPLVAESLRTGGSPIWLGGEVGRQATWPSLVSKATGRDALSFSLSWEEPQELTAEWKIKGDLQGRWQEIESLVIDGEINDPSARKWLGLLPEKKNGVPLPDGLTRARENLLEIRDQVQWIGGVRSRVPRATISSGDAQPLINPNGSDAVEHLVSAQLKSTANPVLEATNSFFNELNEQLILDNPADGIWRVIVQPTGSPHVRVDLCDTGEGYSQVLPVLVALARARTGGPKLLCLEQPELHLHTRAQAELARQLITTVKSSNTPQILVETHSEVLLTSIQLAIAKGEIAPELVRVYWIESLQDGTSDAISVDFNEKGQAENSTLSGAFAEAVQLGQDLITMQLSAVKS